MDGTCARRRHIYSAFMASHPFWEGCQSTKLFRSRATAGPPEGVDRVPKAPPPPGRRLQGLSWVTRIGHPPCVQVTPLQRQETAAADGDLDALYRYLLDGVEHSQLSVVNEKTRYLLDLLAEVSSEVCVPSCPFLLQGYRPGLQSAGHGSSGALDGVAQSTRDAPPHWVSHAAPQWHASRCFCDMPGAPACSPLRLGCSLLACTHVSMSVCEMGKVTVGWAHTQTQPLAAPPHPPPPICLALRTCLVLVDADCFPPLKMVCLEHRHNTRLHVHPPTRLHARTHAAWPWSAGCSRSI